MKHKVTLIIAILIIFATTIIILVNERNNNEKEDSLSDFQNNTIEDNIYKIDSETYTYTLNGNNVLIKYPVLNSNEINLSSVNELIKQTALSEFNEDEEAEQQIDIDYKIVFYNNEFISIAFTGLANTITAAHPNNIFYTLNIDIKEGTKIKLTDIYNIDDNFIDTYKSEFKRQINPEIAIYLENYTDEELKEMFNNADKANDGIFSYYTDTTIGISLPTIFAIGNYSKIEINRDLLKNNLKQQ